MPSLLGDLWGLGSDISSPNGVLDGAPGENRFGAF